MGTFRYNVLGQGVCSSSDFFNLTTDGAIRLDEDFKCLQNMDYFLLFGSTMEVHWCREINLKLSPRKFKLDTQVKFS